jgi:hypothetical protein
MYLSSSCTKPHPKNDYPYGVMCSHCGMPPHKLVPHDFSNAALG